MRLRVHAHKIDDIAALLRLVDEFKLRVSVEHAMDVNRPEIFQELRKRRITVVYDAADIRDVIAAFAAFSGRTIVTGRDVEGMIDGLVAGKLLSGYRGGASVDMDELKKTLIGFSGLMMDMRHLVESIDLNPVMCTEKVCTIADARIMLKKEG